MPELGYKVGIQKNPDMFIHICLDEHWNENTKILNPDIELIYNPSWICVYMCDSRVGSLNHYVRLLFSGIISFSIFSLEVSNLFLPLPLPPMALPRSWCSKDLYVHLLISFLSYWVVQVPCLFSSWWQQPTWWATVSAVLCPLAGE